MAYGKVALVGAGPGDPGLLTLRGKELLEAADVVVYDRLVCDDVLNYAKGARMVYVGKEQGHHPVPQHEINRVLAEEAQGVDLVVRLKGGDPYVFGRGGEEAEYLTELGVEIEVVPGVTSALAALSYAGIPATSRGVAQSVHIITGHAREGGELEINFDALAHATGTLVFLMSVTSMPQITQSLIDAGMDPDTPAAVVQNGTLPSQRRVSATLSTIAQTSCEAGVTSPAILVIGDVCDSPIGLDWRSSLPLFGIPVAVARPLDGAGGISARIRDVGGEAVDLPCIDTHPIGSQEVRDAVAGMAGYGWLVLTSPRGVRYLFEAIKAEGLDARALAGTKVAAVGASTADALAQHGIRADFVPEKHDGKHLGEGLARIVSKDERILLFRAKKGAPGIIRALDEAGIAYDDVAAYETAQVLDESASKTVSARVENGEISLAAFTSASTVEGFCRAVGEDTVKDVTAICIGETTAGAARSHGMNVVVSENATLDALLQAVIETAASTRRNSPR